MHRSPHRKSPARAAATTAIVTLLFLPLPASAAAVDPTARARAEAEVAQGAKLFDQGRFSEALSKYEAAYSFFPSPKIHYSMAFAYQRLGRNAQAFTALERFLREAHDAEAKHLAEARAELGRLSRKVAFVAVSCDTEGAEALLDGTAIGSTPLPARLPVDPGRHEVAIRSRTLGSKTKSFTATAGRALELRVELQPENVGAAAAAGPSAKRALPVSGPAKAEALIREATDLRKASKDARAYPLFLEAYEAQSTPRTAAQLGLVEYQLGYMLEAERHLTEALASPRDPWTSGNRADLEASLARVKAAIGEVVVTGTPAGATVLVNGSPSGNLPVAIVRAGEGPVNIEIRAPDHGPASRSLILLGGRREEVRVALEKAAGPAAAAFPGPPAGGTTLGSASASFDEGDGSNEGRFGRLARPLGWTATALAAASVAFGAYEHTVWRKKFRDFETFVAPAPAGQPPSMSKGDCGAEDPNRGKEGCEALYNSFRRARALTITSYVAGGLLVAGAVTMFVMAPQDGTGGSELACGMSPTLDRGWCRLVF